VHLQLVLGTKPSRFLLPSQNPPSSRTLTPLQHKQRLEDFAQTRVICFQSTRQNNVYVDVNIITIIPLNHIIIHPSLPMVQIFSKLEWEFDANLCHLPTYLPYLPICIASYKLTNVNIFSQHAIVLDASERPKHPLPPPPPPNFLTPPPQRPIRSSISFFFIGEISSKTEIQNSTNSTN